LTGRHAQETPDGMLSRTRRIIVVASFLAALVALGYVGSFLSIRAYLGRLRDVDSRHLAAFYDSAYLPLRWLCAKSEDEGGILRVAFWGMWENGDHYESDWVEAGMLVLPRSVIPQGFDLEVESRRCRVERSVMLMHHHIVVESPERGHRYYDGWSYRITEILTE
jgi:hypothetical protein